MSNRSKQSEIKGEKGVGGAGAYHELGGDLHWPKGGRSRSESTKTRRRPKMKNTLRVGVPGTFPRCVADIGKLTRHEDGDGGGARATRGPWSRTRSSQAPLWISILRSSRVSKGEGKERVGIVCVVCMAWGGDKDEGE